MKRLTLDDHRAVGRALLRLQNECLARLAENEFKKSSPTQYALRRSYMTIRRMRCELHDVIIQFGDKLGVPQLSIYYDYSGATRGRKKWHSVDVWIRYWETAVGNVIDGKVSDKINKQYLRCSEYLYLFKLRIADNPQDRYVGRRA